MKIFVKVITNAKENSVKKAGKGLEVRLKAKPIANKANLELIKVVAKYFKVSKSQVRIVSGKRSSKKILEIDDA